MSFLSQSGVPKSWEKRTLLELLCSSGVTPPWSEFQIATGKFMQGKNLKLHITYSLARHKVGTYYYLSSKHRIIEASHIKKGFRIKWHFMLSVTPFLLVFKVSHIQI